MIVYLIIWNSCPADNCDISNRKRVSGCSQPKGKLFKSIIIDESLQMKRCDFLFWKSPSAGCVQNALLSPWLLFLIFEEEATSLMCHVAGMYVHVPFLEEFEEKVESSCGEPLTTLAFVNMVRKLIESGVNDRHLQVIPLRTHQLLNGILWCILCTSGVIGYFQDRSRPNFVCSDLILLERANAQNCRF